MTHFLSLHNTATLKSFLSFSAFKLKVINGTSARPQKAVENSIWYEPIIMERWQNAFIDLFLYIIQALIFICLNLFAISYILMDRKFAESLHSVSNCKF